MIKNSITPLFRHTELFDDESIHFKKQQQNDKIDEQISKHKKIIDSQNNEIEILKQTIKNMTVKVQELKEVNKKNEDKIIKLTTKNNILEEKKINNEKDYTTLQKDYTKLQKDCTTLNNTFKDSKKKYQELQSRMYFILGKYPSLSYINPKNSCVQVSGKIIDFTYNKLNSNRTGAKVVVNSEITPTLFAFNQFWLNLDKNIDVTNWDKVIIFCPGRLSNINNLKISDNILIKLITNPEIKANKLSNTIGIIVKNNN